MQEPLSDTPLWNRALLAGTIAFVVSAFWPGIEWSPFYIAAAAYFALPPQHRTRANALTIGWSVGFAISFLFVFWRLFTIGQT